MAADSGLEDHHRRRKEKNPSKLRSPPKLNFQEIFCCPVATRIGKLGTHNFADMQASAKQKVGIHVSSNNAKQNT
jgi:hypothetical protein